MTRRERPTGHGAALKNPVDQCRAVDRSRRFVAGASRRGALARPQGVRCLRKGGGMRPANASNPVARFNGMAGMPPRPWRGEKPGHKRAAQTSLSRRSLRAEGRAQSRRPLSTDVSTALEACPNRTVKVRPTAAQPPDIRRPTLPTLPTPGRSGNSPRRDRARSRARACRRAAASPAPVRRRPSSRRRRRRATECPTGRDRRRRARR